MENKYILLIIGGTIILSILVVFIIAFIILYQKRYYKYIKEKQEMQIQFSQNLLQSQIEIQEQTLQNISSEIHDNIGQMASLIKINLNTINPNDKEKTTEKIKDTKDLVKQLIADVKLLSVSMGTNRISKQGLIYALESEAVRINKMGLIKVDFTKEDYGIPLSQNNSIFIYRMAQEILNNIIKHSKATQINILVNNNVKSFTLAIEDNGIGFDINEKTNSADGAGLANLKTRAAYIKANLSIESEPGHGTKVTVELPK